MSEFSAIGALLWDKGQLESQVLYCKDNRTLIEP